MNTTTIITNISDALPLGTHVQVTIDDQPVWAAIAAAHLDRGYRVTNRQWGGTLDTWVSFDAVPA